MIQLEVDENGGYREIPLSKSSGPHESISCFLDTQLYESFFLQICSRKSFSLCFYVQFFDQSTDIGQMEDYTSEDWQQALCDSRSQLGATR